MGVRPGTKYVHCRKASLILSLCSALLFVQEVAADIPKRLLMPTEEFVKTYLVNGYLFHGTSTEDSASKILENEFIRSTKEDAAHTRFGPGVYATPDITAANKYSKPNGLVIKLKLKSESSDSIKVLNWATIKSDPWIQQVDEIARKQGKHVFDVLAEEYGIDVIINEHAIIQNQKIFTKAANLQEAIQESKTLAANPNLDLSLRLVAATEVERFGGRSDGNTVGDLQKKILSPNNIDETVTTPFLRTTLKHSSEPVDYLIKLSAGREEEIQESVINLLHLDEWKYNKRMPEIVQSLVDHADTAVKKQILHLISTVSPEKQPELIKILHQFERNKWLTDDLIVTLSSQYWSQHPDTASILRKILKRVTQADLRAVAKAFGNPTLVNAAPDILEELWASGKADAILIESVLAKANPNSRTVAKVYELVEKGYAGPVAINILSKPSWIQHPDTAKILNIIIDTKNIDHILVSNVLSKEEWINHPDTVQIIKKLMHKNRATEEILIHILSKPQWSTRPETMEFLRQAVDQGYEKLVVALRSKMGGCLRPALSRKLAESVDGL